MRSLKRIFGGNSVIVYFFILTTAYVTICRLQFFDQTKRFLSKKVGHILIYGQVVKIFLKLFYRHTFFYNTFCMKNLKIANSEVI